MGKRNRRHDAPPDAQAAPAGGIPAPAADPAKFRIRGHEITRIEGFSDAVFAFAVTLMVVSLEVPHSYAELAHNMRGFLAFAVCFTMLFSVWFYQHRFFRRYGMQDSTTLVLNAMLLFVVLFYVYPLKFLFTLLAEQLMGNGGAFRTAFDPATGGSQVRDLMVIYSLGYVAIFTVFALLYRHAWRRRGELGLNALEQFETKNSIGYHLISVAVGVLSILIALSGLGNAPFYAGIVYALLGPIYTVFGVVTARRWRRLSGSARSAG